MISILMNVVILCLIFLFDITRKKKALKIIKDWCKKNNYEMIDYKYRLFNQGPFFSYHMITIVYSVKLIDNNVEKDCWIRVGSYYTGMLFNKNIYVEWFDS